MPTHITQLSTPAMLRNLARDIEAGKPPPFVICVVNSDDDFSHAYNGNLGYTYGLLGMMRQVEFEILAEINGYNTGVK